MTFTQARAHLGQAGIKLTRNDGEYRVAFRTVTEPEASAYYTDDLTDAIQTGLLMAYCPGDTTTDRN